MAAGQRNTPQRKRMLEIIQGMDHPTADEVYLLMRNEIPRISMGTVYRNLEVLCDMGLVQRVDMRPAQQRFDRNRRRHYHARCVSCDRVFDVQIDPGVIEQVEELAKVADFEIRGHRLEFRGCCNACKTNSPRQNAKNEEMKEA